jgi:hypothetical protein
LGQCARARWSEGWAILVGGSRTAALFDASARPRTAARVVAAVCTRRSARRRLEVEQHAHAADGVRRSVGARHSPVGSAEVCAAPCSLPSRDDATPPPVAHRILRADCGSCERALLDRWRRGMRSRPCSRRRWRRTRIISHGAKDGSGLRRPTLSRPPCVSSTCAVYSLCM